MTMRRSAAPSADGSASSTSEASAAHRLADISRPSSSSSGSARASCAVAAWAGRAEISGADRSAAVAGM